MRSRNPLILAFTVALLAFGLIGPLAAAEEETEEVTLTGELAQDSAGEFQLIDPESEVEVALRGAEDELADMVGSTVEVTGSWAEDDEGEMYFAVSSVAAA